MNRGLSSPRRKACAPKLDPTKKKKKGEKKRCTKGDRRGLTSIRWVKSTKVTGRAPGKRIEALKRVAL